jgi:FdhD protein
MIISSVQHWKEGRAFTGAEDLADDEPLEIRVQGRAVSVTMRTPGHDAELAAGFLLSEGIIKSKEDIASMAACGHNSNVLHVMLSSGVDIDFARLTRHVFASSSCGLCGKATIASVHAQFPPIERDDFEIHPDIISSLPEKMRARQSTFERTGGLHAAAIFNALGQLIVLREDIGRHNALDKVMGYCLLNDHYPADRNVLLVSGRSSFEIVQKALAGRVPIVAAVSAPSSLAAQFADANGQTLIGFLRERRMNIYTHAHRIALELNATSIY